VGVVYIFGITQYYEIPAGATFVSATASGPLTWTGGPAPVPPFNIPSSGSAPVTVTECLTLTQTGCTASSHSALVNNGAFPNPQFGGFDGPTPTVPYLQVSTGTTKLPAGSTVTTPSLTVNLQATGAPGTLLNWSQFEFDTGAFITLSGGVAVNIVAWPSKLQLDPSTTPPCNGLTVSGTPPSCPTVTFLPLNAVNAAGTGAGTLDSGLEAGTPPVLTSTTISAPAPFINVTNSPPINSTSTGVTINVTGANWPASTSGTFAWSGGVGANTDTGTFTVSTGGALTGSILFGPAEQLPTSQTPITLTLTATDGAAVASTQVTVNPFQAFQSMCTFGSPAAPAGTCTINQTISATVIGTSLTISEIQTPPNGSNSAVTLSPVTLGITGPTCPAVPGTACNNQQFAQAQGLLNSVVVSDDRGTLTGWDVTGQLAGDFTNATPHGPAMDNVIPADFLTWVPSVALETPGSLPGNNANTPGCPDQTPPPIPVVCTGPSGLPSTTGAAGGAGGNGTGAPVTSTSAPAEVTAGGVAVLNNAAGSADDFCGTVPRGPGHNPGGGGGFICSAQLSLAVPPYVGAGTYSATMNIVVIGF
jgi:hypothetical protein